MHVKCANCGFNMPWKKIGEDIEVIPCQCIARKEKNENKAKSKKHIAEQFKFKDL